MPSPPIIDAGKVLPRLERLLADVVVPYWFPDKVDPTGGYNLNHGNDGGWLGPADKLVVTQVRMLLAAARLLRERDVLPDGIDVGDLRAAADHGFAFLRDRMWDPEHDGVFWSVDSDGAPRESSKHLLAQADALAALAEYARATGSDAAADLAGRLFARIEQARDRRFGGYHEQHSRDWTPIGEGGRKLVGIAPHRKSAMTHLHLLIAMTHYQPIAPAGTIGERLAELILILTTTATRLREGAPTEVHAANWRPARPADGHRVSYGHIAEIAWWAPAAAQAAGLAPAMVASHSISLLDKLVDDALDPDDGGVFHEGPIAGKADRRTKVWWVQVEALRAFAEWHRWSDDLRFASAFLDILRWIENRQVVGPAGDLHHRIEPDGRSAGARAGAWKCPYHQVVGLLGAIRMMYADSQPFVA